MTFSGNPEMRPGNVHMSGIIFSSFEWLWQVSFLSADLNLLDTDIMIMIQTTNSNQEKY